MEMFPEESAGDDLILWERRSLKTERAIPVRYEGNRRCNMGQERAGRKW